jgi:hypothetical protein
VIAYVALAVSFAGATIAIVTLRLNYRQRLRQFEQMYVERYWHIIDRCSLAAMSTKSSDTDLSEEDQKAIRAYIRLCEEELMVRREGWISDVTYKIWAESTCTMMKLPMFAKVWNQVPEDSIFPHEYLTELLSRGKGYDPCKMNRFVRWLHVLTEIPLRGSEHVDSTTATAAKPLDRPDTRERSL